jgi:transcriptional regulator with XRE-family HTH domain
MLAGIEKHAILSLIGGDGMDCVETGKRLAGLRRFLKLSTRAFAKRLNLSDCMVSCMESCSRNTAKRTMAQLCSEFNVSGKRLSDGGGEMLKAVGDSGFEDVIRAFLQPSFASGSGDLIERVLKCHLGLPLDERTQFNNALLRMITCCAWRAVLSKLSLASACLDYGHQKNAQSNQTPYQNVDTYQNANTRKMSLNVIIDY